MGDPSLFSILTSTGASPVLEASTIKFVGFPGKTLSGSKPGPYASTLLALGLGLPSLVTHGTLSKRINMIFISSRKFFLMYKIKFLSHILFLP